MKKIHLLIAVSIGFTNPSIFGQDSPDFANGVELGQLEYEWLSEASGLAASQKNKNVIWSHNDSGDDNVIYALNLRGEHLGIYTIEGAADARDWEDIAVGPGPDEEESYIYIGEIGDNYSQYDEKYIYRVPEPDVDANQEPVETTLTGVETITYQYPDGNRDSETLMVDPLTKDIYVVSKREWEDIRVYRAPYPQSTSELITLDHVATLTLYNVVGGDISPSGLEILIKTYPTIYYWNRSSDENLWEVFDEEPVVLPYIEEMQGEAVCWDADGMGYFTAGEESAGIESNLYVYPRINPSVVIINEIMPDPLSVDDGNGEWFEIYNNSDLNGETIDLNGWVIMDNGTDSHSISQSLTLAPGEFLVLGNNSDENSNGGLVVDYQYSGFSLDNSGDEIVIISPEGTVIDSVEYSSGNSFPNIEGVSMSLLNPNLNNGNGYYWRKATDFFGAGDLGTPGGPNSPVASLVAIRDIQYTTDSSGDSPLLDQEVKISGIITTGSFRYDDMFFVQDSVAAWSGIMINYTEDVTVGDSVTLSGTVEEYSNVTILLGLTDFEILDAIDNGIEPSVVSTGEIGTGGDNSEAFEGVLVRVEGICDNDDFGYGEWSLDDASGPVRVDDFIYDEFIPVLGTSYQVTGILYYSYGEFKILPRDENDIVEILSVDYNVGWNMVGLPLYVEDASYGTLFPDAVNGTLYGYDDSYYGSDVLETGNGYWLVFTTAGSADISGEEITSLTISLSEGWNLIAGISSPVAVESISDPSSIIVSGTIYGYGGSYYNADAIEPGKGYWVNASADGEITLSSTNLVTKTLAQINHLEGSNTLELSNGTHSSTLYFGKDMAEEYRNSYSLPPTFPQMAFDVRFNGDMKYTVESGDIEVLNTSDNLTISYDVIIDAGEHMNWVLTSESGKEYILEGTGEITIPSAERFVLNREPVIPITFALHQNYPNPFNPITSLRYDLPEQAQVTLTIYDLMGREVTQLVNTTQEAGYRSVQWNATDMHGKPVSAGVYLYQIRAGEFVQTKKMVLLK